MAIEVGKESIHPQSTGAVTPDTNVVTLTNAAADNSSTHTVHPEPVTTIVNPAFMPRSEPPLVESNPAAPIAAAEVETKVVKPKSKPAPKTSQPAETK